MQRPLGQEGSEDAEEELIDSPAGVAGARIEGAGGDLLHQKTLTSMLREMENP